MEVLVVVLPSQQLCSPLNILGGQSFPTDVNPTSSGRKQPRATLSPKESSKAISARQLCGSGKRTQADIQKRLENDEDEPYRPKPGSKLKLDYISIKI